MGSSSTIHNLESAKQMEIYNIIIVKNINEERLVLKEITWFINGKCCIKFPSPHVSIVCSADIMGLRGKFRHSTGKSRLDAVLNCTSAYNLPDCAIHQLTISLIRECLWCSRLIMCSTWIQISGRRKKIFSRGPSSELTVLHPSVRRFPDRCRWSLV